MTGKHNSGRFIRGLGEEDHALATEAGASERNAILRHYDEEPQPEKRSKDKREPDIFQYTAYRLPSESDLDDIHSCNLSSDQVLSGFVYTLVGKGVTTKKNIQDIITSIDRLNRRHPDRRYQIALAKAKKLVAYHGRVVP